MSHELYTPEWAILEGIYTILTKEQRVNMEARSKDHCDHIIKNEFSKIRKKPNEIQLELSTQ